MQKLFLTIAFLCCALIPSRLSTQNLAQDLQNFSVSLQHVTTFLTVTQPRQPTKPDEPTKPDQPSGTPIPPLSEEMTFTKWKEKCDNLPNYDYAKRNELPKETALNFELFTKTLDEYFATTKPILENSANWLNRTMPTDTTAWNTDNKIPEEAFGSQLALATQPIPFVPFVEKRTFKTTDIIAFHGDFHGDIHAFNNFIQTWITAKYMDNNFKIIDDNFYIIFLGDYTDRGWYGAEIIYALLRVKLANPTHVFMVRGNHEDLNIIAKYGFVAELFTKFEEQTKVNILLNKITRLYNFFPLAFYLICPSNNRKDDVIQCCHGGIEIGYSPTKFLTSKAQFAYIDKFHRTNNYNILKKEGYSNLSAEKEEFMLQKNVEPDTHNGFMWNDFIADDLSMQLRASTRGANLFEYGNKSTKKLLNLWSLPTYTLRAIFRAHQHDRDVNDPMKQVILNFKLEPPSNPEYNNIVGWYKAPQEDAGIAFLWSDSVRDAGSLKDILALTFSVSPGTSYDWPYDAFGLLKLADGYDNWNMHVYRATRNQYEKEKK